MLLLPGISASRLQALLKGPRTSTLGVWEKLGLESQPQLHMMQPATHLPGPVLGVRTTLTHTEHYCVSTEP